jgi:hypothetical protein
MGTRRALKLLISVALLVMLIAIPLSGCDSTTQAMGVLAQSPGTVTYGISEEGESRQVVEVRLDTGEPVYAGIDSPDQLAGLEQGDAVVVEKQGEKWVLIGGAE